MRRGTTRRSTRDCRSPARTRPSSPKAESIGCGTDWVSSGTRPRPCSTTAAGRARRSPSCSTCRASNGSSGPMPPPLCSRPLPESTRTIGPASSLSALRSAASPTSPTATACSTTSRPPTAPALSPSSMRALRPGGLFAFWENNPWNPGTRMIMRRIPFDRDAVMVAPAAARRLLIDGGLEVVSTEFRFYFPAPLRRLRPLEPHLRRLPLGAQYLVLARKRLSVNSAAARMTPTGTGTSRSQHTRSALIARR